MSKFGPLLGTVLTQRREKLTALAHHIGVSETFLRDVRDGRRGPLRADQIARAAEFLDVSAAPLIEASIEDRGTFELHAPSAFTRAVGSTLAAGWGELTKDELAAIGRISAAAADRRRKR